jgi:hypothetical protein
MKLKVVSPYKSSSTVYEVGQVLDLPDNMAAWLLRDAPGCFEVLLPEGSEVEYRDASQLEARDRMMRRPRTRR